MMETNSEVRRSIAGPSNEANNTPFEEAIKEVNMSYILGAFLGLIYNIMLTQMNLLDQKCERDSLIFQARNMLSQATVWSPNNDILQGAAAVIRKCRATGADDSRVDQLILDLNQLWSRAVPPGHYRFVLMANLNHCD